LQDFSGFRLLVLLPRERVMWPAPGQYDKPEPKKHPLLGAPLDPLPGLQVRCVVIVSCTAVIVVLLVSAQVSSYAAGGIFVHGTLPPPEPPPAHLATLQSDKLPMIKVLPHCCMVSWSKS
jgi:hypothetical protein